MALNLILGPKAQHALTEMKGWLIDNNVTVKAILFLVLGAKVLGDGISIVALQRCRDVPACGRPSAWISLDAVLGQGDRRRVVHLGGTVKKPTVSLYQKLHVGSRREAVKKATSSAL